MGQSQYLKLECAEKKKVKHGVLTARHRADRPRKTAAADDRILQEM